MRGAATIATTIVLAIGATAATASIALTPQTASRAAQAREARALSLAPRNIVARCQPYRRHERCAVKACFKMFVGLPPTWVRFHDDVYLERNRLRVVPVKTGTVVDGFCAPRISRSLSWLRSYASRPVAL